MSCYSVALCCDVFGEVRLSFCPTVFLYDTWPRGIMFIYLVLGVHVLAASCSFVCSSSCAGVFT